MNISNSTVSHDLLALALMGGVLTCIHWSSKALVKNHATYIRSIWYFYFLLACVTFAVGALCSKFGAIDATGNFKGEGGAAVNGLLKFVFALNEDFYSAVGLVALVLLPQGLSYVFGGVLSGVAMRPRFAGPVVRFALLSLGKSFVVAAGIFLGLGVGAWTYGWTGMGAPRMIGLALLSVTLLMVAFYMFAGCAFTDPKFPIDIGKSPKRLQAIHRFMTRNNPKPATADAQVFTAATQAAPAVTVGKRTWVDRLLRR